MAAKGPCRSSQPAVCELRWTLEYNLKNAITVQVQSQYLGLQVIKYSMFWHFVVCNTLKNLHILRINFEFSLNYIFCCIALFVPDRPPFNRR